MVSGFEVVAWGRAVCYTLLEPPTVPAQCPWESTDICRWWLTLRRPYIPWISHLKCGKGSLTQEREAQAVFPSLFTFLQGSTSPAKKPRSSKNTFVRASEVLVSGYQPHKTVISPEMSSSGCGKLNGGRNLGPRPNFPSNILWNPHSFLVLHLGSQ